MIKVGAAQVTLEHISDPDEELLPRRPVQSQQALDVLFVHIVSVGTQFLLQCGYGVHRDHAHQCEHDDAHQQDGRDQQEHTFDEIFTHDVLSSQTPVTR